MTIYEPRQPIQVITPKGKGRIWLVTEYGPEIEKIFTIILDENCEIWEFTNKDIKACNNSTLGRIKIS